jgi:hypothetical protein
MFVCTLLITHHCSTMSNAATKTFQVKANGFRRRIEALRENVPEVSHPNRQDWEESFASLLVIIFFLAEASTLIYYLIETMPWLPSGMLQGWRLDQNPLGRLERMVRVADHNRQTLQGQLLASRPKRSPAPQSGVAQAKRCNETVHANSRNAHGS